MAGEEGTRGVAPCEEAAGVCQGVEEAAERSQVGVEEGGEEGKMGWVEVAWWR